MEGTPISKGVIKTFLGGYLYFSILLHYIPNKNNVPDTKKYSLHFQWLTGQENSPIHTINKRTSLVMADSPTTNVLFVNDVWVLESAPGFL